MKHIKNILAAPALLGLCALSSCGDSKDAPAADAKPYSDTSGESFKAADFSPWMTKADQQIAYDNRKEGTYFAYTEGRGEGGLQQFRHVVKAQPTDAYSRWGVYWGLNAKEFYQVDLKLQREGFTRRNLQVFEDGSGTAFHQAVWVLKK